MIYSAIVFSFLLAFVGAVTPYNNCPEQQQRSWSLKRRANSAPGTLTAEEVYQDGDGGWHARYHLVIDDIDNVGPDTVAEVKLISPYQVIYYSENIPGDYEDENWFDWEFTIDFAPTDESDCTKIVIPRVMIQYDYKAGGYNSDDYSTGCNNDDNGPEYAFSSCPNPHTDTATLPTGGTSTVTTAFPSSTVTLTGATSEGSQSPPTCTYVTSASHSQYDNSASTQGVSATTNVVTDTGTTYLSTETQTPGTETLTFSDPGSTFESTETKPGSTVVHSSILSGSSRVLSTETQSATTKTHSITESGSIYTSTATLSHTTITHTITEPSSTYLTTRPASAPTITTSTTIITTKDCTDKPGECTYTSTLTYCTCETKSGAFDCIATTPVTNIPTPRPTSSGKVTTHHFTSMQAVPCEPDDDHECTTVYTARSCEKQGSPVPCNPPHPRTSSHGPQPPLPPQSDETGSRPAVGPQPAIPSSSENGLPPVPPIPAGSTTYSAKGAQPASDGNGGASERTGSAEGAPGSSPASGTLAPSPTGNQPTQGDQTSGRGGQGQPSIHGTNSVEASQGRPGGNGANTGQGSQTGELSQKPTDTGTQGIVNPSNDGSVKVFDPLTAVLVVVANLVF
ncbi:hypothetical protein TRICI_002499 [Trichomonascus ciferrii]|uniref:Flo11 domain-containing protein n=1 Tax=Trichomonascus ciferrii TaxID=44093 RepID=A0A642V5R6_9ASCO|nr:hypothetical protein TRICI_002499 [Trichomonascus ciferrii]